MFLNDQSGFFTCIGNRWMVNPDSYKSMKAAVCSQNWAEDVPRGIMWPERPAMAAASTVSRAKRIAVLPLTGMIEHTQSMMGYFFGGTSTVTFGEMFDRVVADDSVSAVAIRADSPGGVSYGVPELADKIFAAREVKPIVGIADPVAYSAAYWILSAANMVVATPSGGVGSVGVFATHIDASEYLANLGIKETHVVADDSPYKTQFADNAPLSEDAEQKLQAEVNELMDEFVDTLARNFDKKASEVKQSFGGGGTVTSANAKQVAMIDRVATFEDTIARMASGRIRINGRKVEADWDEQVAPVAMSPLLFAEPKQVEADDPISVDTRRRRYAMLTGKRIDPTNNEDAA